MIKQEESLPGSGKGGIVQVVFAGKTSTSLEISSGPPSVPPVIMRPARGGLYIYTRQVQNFCPISTGQT